MLQQTWPVWSEELIQEETVTVILQVNQLNVCLFILHIIPKLVELTWRLLEIEIAHVTWRLLGIEIATAYLEITGNYYRLPGDYWRYYS